MAFFDFLTGGGAKRELESAYGDATRSLQEGYADARKIGEDYYGRATQRLQPWEQGGRDADAIVRQALGLSGRDAQADYYRNFLTDPGFQGEMDAGVRAIDKSAAARGGLYSGRALKDVSRYGQEMMRGAYDQRLNHLLNYGNQGRQTSASLASLDSDLGGRLMEMRSGYGQQQAANRINYGNSAATAKGTLFNNLAQFGGLAVKAYSAGAGGGAGAR